MQATSSGRALSDINVTPMIDVILVLLIIFMVITPVVQMGYLTRVPEPAPRDDVTVNQVVLRYDADGAIWINQDRVDVASFPARLQETIGGNSGKMVFFAGDPEADYQKTMEFLDLANASGARNIGLIVDPID